VIVSLKSKIEGVFLRPELHLIEKQSIDLSTELDSWGNDWRSTAKELKKGYAPYPINTTRLFESSLRVRGLLSAMTKELVHVKASLPVDVIAKSKKQLAAIELLLFQGERWLLEAEEIGDEIRENHFPDLKTFKANGWALAQQADDLARFAESVPTGSDGCMGEYEVWAPLHLTLRLPSQRNL
jgi:hypothetical protein